MRIILRAAAPALAAVTAIAVHAASPLPRLAIDPHQVTVSGLSSGAFMAVQLGYAYSATFSGVGVFAGGPYMCAGHSNYTACMYDATISAAMLSTMQSDIDTFSGTTNDDKAHVATQQVYLFVGNSDYTVGPNPMAAVHSQYTTNGVAAGHLDDVRRDNTAHVFPTDFDGSGDNACNTSASPYIANCGYDGAQAAFTRFYGALQPRNDSPPAGNYIEFDQTAFTSNPGMAPTGWIYVPASCAAGATCRLHVALHGCLQNYATIGDKFLKNTGYTRWADTNGIVVLFPQTRVDNTSRQTAASGQLPNPNGCWDWIGWYGNDFAQRSGSQQAAIKAMVDQVSSGSGGGGGGLPAPTGVATSNATNTTMKITWNAVAGAAGYDVYREGSRVTASPVTTTAYTDTGLAPATTYHWTVSAVDSHGVEGAQSAPVAGTTTGAKPVCYTANNYAQTVAGRAHQNAGHAYANGSNQDMGLWNVFVITTLKKTGANFYVIGTCP
jgi:poly(3-hydroxybutyrate) depolymerase